tara:strand:- start:97 stop:996 length:900 start_codon:yes stop_codon:yes gene_type:complete
MKNTAFKDAKSSGTDKAPFDLNIDNYTLDDILDLFQLKNSKEKTGQITFDDLKHAKKIVMQTHPDKSRLDPSIFLFFSEALKILVYLYTFKNKSNDLRDNYSDNLDDEVDQDMLRFSKTSRTNSTKFNSVFNQLFDKSYIPTEEEKHGYSKLLKSNYEMNDESFSDKKKRLLGNMVVYHTPQELNKHRNNITGERPQEYSSNVFDKLQYDDIKKSQEHNILPIDESLLAGMKTFSSLDEIKRFRSTQKLEPMIESSKILENQERMNDELSMHSAYLLIQQSNKLREKQEDAIRQFKLLR